MRLLYKTDGIEVCREVASCRETILFPDLPEKRAASSEMQQARHSVITRLPDTSWCDRENS